MTTILTLKQFEVRSLRVRSSYIKSRTDRIPAFLQQVPSKAAMQPIRRVLASLCFLTVVLGNNYHSSAKLRRDGVLNLYPFPRVGRASHRTWQVPVNDLYLDYESVGKRQLYAFPRVGRGESFGEERPGGPTAVRRTDSPGMWFGPRLGRSLKLDDDEPSIQNSNRDHSEPELIESIHEDREKRQIDSM